MTILEFFEGHPEKWTKGQFARDFEGNGVSYASNEAVCWCLVGASLKVYYGETRDINIAFHHSLEELGLYYKNFIAFNDAPETTFDTLIKVLKKAKI